MPSRTRVTRHGRETLRELGLNEREVELVVARLEAENVTGACDIGAHRDCAPNAAVVAAGGCECFCHKMREDA